MEDTKTTQNSNVTKTGAENSRAGFASAPAMGGIYSPDGAGPVNTPLPEVPVQEMEYSKGAPDSAKFSIDYPEGKEQSVVEGNGPTTQLSDYSAANQFLYDSPFNGALENELGGDDAIPTSGLNKGNLRMTRTSKYAQPIALFRGLNAISPFGIVYAYSQLGTQGVVSFGQLSGLESAYAQATGTLRSQFSLREVNNFKAFAEMKDAIISYKSRSIAYTNLDTIDMFLLEAKRESGLLEAAMPLFAGKAAREYVQDLAAAGLSYSPELYSNLTDPELQQAELRLYTILQNQPTFDEESWKRLGMFTKLHVSSARTGNIPQYLVTDVSVCNLAGYCPTGKVGSYVQGVLGVERNMNYNIGAQNTFRFTPTDTFIGWVYRYLGGKQSRDSLLSGIETAISLANGVVNGFKVITGAVDTIEGNRGAKFPLIAEFLPVKGIHVNDGCSFLDWIIGKPIFTYYFKEKVEHAPKFQLGEGPSGANNYPYYANQCNIPTYSTSITQRQYEGLQFQRPVGLYKGDNAWTVEEIIHIGIFRSIDTVPLIQAFAFNYFAGGSLDTLGAEHFNFLSKDAVLKDLTFTKSSVSGNANLVAIAYNQSAIQNLPAGMFVDMVFGDLFFDCF